MFHVPPDRADEAWRDGAHRMSEACERSDGDMTGAHLLARIKSGELTLLGHAGSWCAVQVQVLPAKRVLHVEAVHAPGMDPAVFDELKALARHNGCAEVQCACQPAPARLMARKFGFRPVYQVMRVAA